MSSSSINASALEALPSGVITNITNPQSLVPATAIVVAISMAIMTLFVLLRLYCRVWVVKSIAGDDGESFPG